ncbi:MAG: hypothetical protein IT578_00475 [Verrucomicrobiae bacterium]|nr:hypothetical protein [Verrucomicrobiae bacterium]
MNPLACHTAKLSDAQARLVEWRLRKSGFIPHPTPHACFAGRKDGLTAVFPESDKGDFFGPMVIRAVFADADAIRAFREAGVRDPKNPSLAARA